MMTLNSYQNVNKVWKYSLQEIVHDLIFFDEGWSGMFVSFAMF